MKNKRKHYAEKCKKNLSYIGIFLFFFVFSIFSTQVYAARENAFPFESYKIYTYRDDSLGIPPNGTASTDGCHIVIEATFPDTLNLTDPEAAAASLQVSSGTSVGMTGNITVSAEGNVLTIDAESTFMPGGIIQFDEAVINGLTCGGEEVTWPGTFRTVVPTGLLFHVIGVTVGTATTPASTTIQVDSSSCIRSMNHILWTSNGASILSGTGTSQTTAAHHHSFWSMSLADSANSIASNAAGSLSNNGYIVTAEGDRVTITANEATDGEYLGIYNYDDNFLQENSLSLSDSVTDLNRQETETTRTFRITKPLEKSMFAVDTSDETFKGSAFLKTVTPVTGLTEGTDYTVRYTNNAFAGTSSIIITGAGAYSGTLTYTYTIHPTSITADLFTVDTTAKTYTGGAIQPTVSASGLRQNMDYTVSYQNNVQPGTATITVTGNGNYAGTLTWNFTILNSLQRPTAERQSK